MGVHPVPAADRGDGHLLRGAATPGGADLKRVLARRWPLLLALWAFAATVISAAAILAARNPRVDFTQALIWQGLSYAAWAPLCWLAWRLGRRLETPRREIVYFAATPLTVPLHALFTTLLDAALSPVSRTFGARLAERLPIDLLIYSAIGAALVAVAMTRRAEAASAAAAELAVALKAARDTAPGDERIAVAVGARGRTFVAMAEIEQIVGAGNYCAVRWADREGLVRETLQSFAGRLNPQVFVRIHRSTIVNLAKVRQAAPLADGAWRLTLESGAEAVVSKTYRDDLLARLSAG